MLCMQATLVCSRNESSNNNTLSQELEQFSPGLQRKGHFFLFSEAHS